jgi:DNA polymerase I-like protein with 3'-5' exonuclease and polymerase domains
VWYTGRVLLPHVPDHQPIAVDTETSGLFVDGDPGKAPRARVSVVSAAWRDEAGRLIEQVWPFDQGWLEGKPGRCAWSPRGRAGWFPLPPQPLWRCQKTGQMADYESGEHNLPAEDLAPLLAWLKRHPLLMHHAKFDCHILAAGHRLVPDTGLDLSGSVVWDTQHGSGLIWPLEPSSLKPTAKRLWGEEEGDWQVAIEQERKKQGKGLTWRYDLLTWPVLGAYAGRDANQTYRLWEHQTACAEEGAVPRHFEQVRRMELELMQVLFAMERRGVGFDRDAAWAEHDKLVVLLDEAKERLPFKATDPGARKYFGVPSIAGDVARELAKSSDPEIASAAQLWIQVKSLQSAQAKWYRGWPAATGTDGRLRTNYRQMRIESDRPGGRTGGAISGRLSVERVQLQAIPHLHQIPPGLVPVRKLFRPKPSHDNWELDISQAEVRVATSITRCRGMLEVLTAGTDVHGQTASLVFDTVPGDPMWDQYRAVAKRLTFATIYGAGVRTLREQILLFTGVDYSESETRSLKARYDDTFPEFKRGMWEAQARVDVGMGGCGYLTMRVTGRRRTFGYGERTHKAFNAVIQGTVAELMKLWMIEIERDYPGLMLLQIHDSVVLEVPLGEEYVLDKIQDRGAELFRSKLVEIGAMDVPFKLDRKRWSDAS